MGAARFHVSFEMLRECLHLPPGTEIRFVTTTDYNEATLTVIHPDLRDVPLSEGELPPIVTPTFRKQEPVVFIEWGQR